MSIDVDPQLELSAPEPIVEVVEAPQQRPISFGRFRRWIGGALLAVTVVTGAVHVAEQPKTAAIEAAQIVADDLYHDTPIGWAAQAFDAYMSEEAGWDHPTYTEFKLYTDDEAETPKHPLVTNFIFTGLREMHGEEIASEISAATNHQDRVRYQENGNQPITPDMMAKQLITSIEEHPLDTPTIGFTCHSMGGIMLLETLDHLHQMGYKLPKIAFIDFLSTPSGMQTARFGSIGDFLTKTQIGESATGAIVSSIFSQMQAQHFAPKWFGHDFAYAFEQLPQGASPALTESQMGVLDSIDNVQTLMAKLVPLRGVISPDTKLFYYAPMDPESDTVVNDVAAYQQIAYAFKKVLGVNVTYVRWGTGHADTNFPQNPRASANLRSSEQPAAALVPQVDEHRNPQS